MHRDEDAIIKRYQKAVGNQSSMNYCAFVAATGCRSAFFAKRLFQLIDADNSGDITYSEFAAAVGLLQARDSHLRMEFIFRLIDEDGGGTVELQELTKFLQASVEETNVSFSQEELRDLARKLMEVFLEERDPDKRTQDISLEEFARLMKRYPDMLSGLSLDGITGSAGERSQKRRETKTAATKLVDWALSHRQLTLVYVAYSALLLALFLWRFVRYAGHCKKVDLSVVDEVSGLSRLDVQSMANAWRRGKGLAPISVGDMKYMAFSKAMMNKDSQWCQDARKRKLLSWSLPVAKGAAQAMKGTFTLILLPVSRNLLTALQNTFVKDIFPLYSAIAIHRNMGIAGFVLAWIHVVCHVVDIVRWSDTGRFERWSWAFPQTGRGFVEDGLGGDEEDVTKFNGIPAYLFRNPGSQPTAKELMGSWFGMTGICMIFIYTVTAMFAFDYPKGLKVFDETMADKACPISWNRRLVLRVGKSLRNFNNFWYTHHLFAIFYTCLIVHPLPHIPNDRKEWGWSDCWVWIWAPVSIYFFERLLRLLRTHPSNTEVTSVDIYQGNVVHIKVQKPVFFEYHAGMYAFLKIPELSPFEWHPFTLTSSPGDQFLGFHIRAAGDWTQALHDMIKKYVESRAAIEDREAAMSITKSSTDVICGVDKKFPFTVEVDGPFGARAQNFKNFEVMILVGAGIGVTPFASAINDLLDYIKCHKCKVCGASTGHTTIKKVWRLQHMHFGLICNLFSMQTNRRDQDIFTAVSYGTCLNLMLLGIEEEIKAPCAQHAALQIYFYWTTRLRNEVIWFKHLLEEIAVEDTVGLFDINIHVTSFRDAKDIRMVLLRLAQTKVAENEGVDIVSNVRTRAVTKFGRPDWDEVFTRVSNEYPEAGNVGVFYCGPRALGRVLASYCEMYSVSERKFHIMRESFG